MYYVTKFALTRGIIMAPADARIYESDGGVKYLTWKVQHHSEFLAPSDYTTDLAVSIKRAREMRDAKIVSLKKQISRLEKLTFARPAGVTT